MRQVRSDGQRWRVFLSICAAAAAAMICQAQHHFVLSVTAPHGLRVMTTHKCGLLLLATVLWMMGECVFAVVHEAGRLIFAQRSLEEARF